MCCACALHVIHVLCMCPTCDTCDMHVPVSQDVKSYMNVGMPESRIFTVNHKVSGCGHVGVVT